MSYQPTFVHPGPYPYAPPPSSGLAVASFVLGILAILGCLVPFLNIVSIVLAAISIVLGSVALSAVRRGRAAGTGLAVAGIVLSVLAVLGAVLVNTLLFSTVTSIGGVVDQIRTEQDEAADMFPGATVHDAVAEPGEPIRLHDLAVTATALVAQVGPSGPAVCTTVTYVNEGPDVVAVGAADWILQEPDGGFMRSPDVFGTSDLLPVDLAPGATAAGDVCFPGEPVTGELVLLFDDGRLDEDTLQPERGAWLSTL